MSKITKQDQRLYEEVEYALRSSIPSMSRNIQEGFFKNLAKKTSLFGQEMYNRTLNAAHETNLAANVNAEKNRRRIEDTVLHSHYATELGMREKDVHNILTNFPPMHPDRIDLEAKIATLGKINPNIGALQQSSEGLKRHYASHAINSFNVLTTPRTPNQRANALRYMRKRIP